MTQHGATEELKVDRAHHSLAVGQFRTHRSLPSGPDASVTCNANAIPRPAISGRIYSYAGGGRRLKSALPSAIRACGGSFPKGAGSDQQKESDNCHYVVTLPTQIFLGATFAETASRG